MQFSGKDFRLYFFAIFTFWISFVLNQTARRLFLYTSCKAAVLILKYGVYSVVPAFLVAGL